MISDIRQNNKKSLSIIVNGFKKDRINKQN